MKPYLAVIYDSFIEAAQSRVLWVLLFAWAIILAAIAPFGLLEGTTNEVQSDQILDRAKLTEIFMQAAEGNGTAAQNAVWSAMEPKFQQTIVERQKSKRGGRLAMGELADGLNSVLNQPELYDEKAWPTAAKRSILKELLSKSNEELSEAELQRRNRELLQLTFPGLIRPGESNLNWVAYAGIKIGQPLPSFIKKKQIRPLFEAVVLMSIFKFGVGLVGILVGIIVTSTLVPDMFQVGSMHLLLSKPISRTWLLIAKFVGGTCFVFLNFSILLLGFYFLVGVRLGFWNQGILLCIPLLVFVFMIYYSVSMFVGLIWRNAIVSIVVTMLFWGLCTSLGFTHAFMQVFAEHSPEIVQLTPTANTICSVSNSGQMKLWDREAKRWQNAFGTSFVDEAVIGPFWLEEQESLYFGKPRRLDFGMALQSEDVQLKFASFGRMEGSKDQQIDESSANVNGVPLWSDKRVDVGPTLPPRTRRVVKWNKTLAVLAERGLHCFDVDGAKTDDSKEKRSLFGLDKLFRSGSNTLYPLMTPEDWMPEPPLDLAFCEPRNEFVVYSKGKLIVLTSSGERNYDPKPPIDLDLPEGSLALVACNGKFAIVATNQSGLIRVDLSEPANRIKVAGTEGIVPRSIEVSPVDGSFGILDRDGYFRLLDQAGQKIELPSLKIQGAIVACSIDENQGWWFAHHVNRVMHWNATNGKVIEELTPTRSLLERIFFNVVNPLYRLNPKPAAVDAAMQKVLVSSDPLSLGRQTTELEIDRRPKEDPWFAIWSNAAFIAVMLVCSCWYLHRQDL